MGITRTYAPPIEAIYDDGRLVTARCLGCGFWWHAGFGCTYQEFVDQHAEHEGPG